MFNKPQNHPGTHPSDGESSSPALLQSPFCVICALKFRSLQEGSLTTKVNLLMLRTCHGKVCVPQQLRGNTRLEILLLLFKMKQQLQFSLQRGQGLHTIEICAWISGSLDPPGFSPFVAVAQLPTEELSQPCHSPAVIWKRSMGSLVWDLWCGMLWEAMRYFFPHKNPAPAMQYFSFSSC